MDALLAGFVLGAGVAAGIGPISLLCVTSGIRNGFAPAFGVGLGAALIDGLYAFAAGLGAAALIVGRTSAALQIVGGLALLAIAGHTAFSAARGGAAVADFGRGLRLSLGLTLANPMTIVSWAGAFTAVVPGLGLTGVETALVLPLGVTAGSLAWFTGLSAATALAHARINDSLLHALSLVGALAVGAFGAWSLVSGVRALA